MPAEFKKYQAIFMQMQISPLIAIDLSSSVMNAVMKLQQRQYLIISTSQISNLCIWEHCIKA